MRNCCRSRRIGNRNLSGESSTDLICAVHRPCRLSTARTFVQAFRRTRMGRIHVWDWRCRGPHSSIAQPSAHSRKKNWLCPTWMEAKDSIQLLLFFYAMLDMVVETFVDLRVRSTCLSCRMACSETYEHPCRVPRARLTVLCSGAILVYENCSCPSQ